MISGGRRWGGEVGGVRVFWGGWGGGSRRALLLRDGIPILGFFLCFDFGLGVGGGRLSNA